jgi:hypothetical protein
MGVLNTSWPFRRDDTGFPAPSESGNGGEDTIFADLMIAPLEVPYRREGVSLNDHVFSDFSVIDRARVAREVRSVIEARGIPVESVDVRIATTADGGDTLLIEATWFDGEVFRTSTAMV